MARSVLVVVTIEDNRLLVAVAVAVRSVHCIACEPLFFGGCTTRLYARALSTFVCRGCGGDRAGVWQCGSYICPPVLLSFLSLSIHDVVS
eukprot:scaffold35626_cov124-Isochrysis_galbana.AAC.2